MKKEHSKYQWIIGICCSENDGVKLYKYTGTVKKMKKRLLRLIKEDKKNDKENWESGSETVAELSDESNGEETCFCGYGSYSYYHIDYMAERVSNIEELSNCESGGVLFCIHQMKLNRKLNNTKVRIPLPQRSRQELAPL